MKILRTQIGRNLEAKSLKRRLLEALVGLSVAFLMGGILIWAVGGDPALGIFKLVEGSLGGQRQIANTLTKAAPILLISIGLSVAFTVKFWNIGAEGQFFMGAVFSTFVGLNIGDSLGYFGVPVCILAGFVGGMLPAFIAAILKVKLKVNEMLFTLMTNFIITLFTSYLLFGPWMAPGGVMPQTVHMSPVLLFPNIPLINVQSGFLLSIIFVPLVYIIIRKTSLGYVMRATGDSIRASSALGLPVNKGIVVALIISGGLAGLAGTGEVFGAAQRLRLDISPGYGYIGILLAILGTNDPIWVTVASLFYSMLVVGGDVMGMTLNISTTLIPVFLAIIFITMLAVKAAFEYRRRVS